jgi:hypothetical protein
MYVASYAVYLHSQMIFTNLNDFTTTSINKKKSYTSSNNFNNSNCTINSNNNNRIGNNTETWKVALALA